MSDTKHTPGPWVVYKYPASDKYEVWHMDMDGVSHRICGPVSTVLDNEGANARLIAAAPDLLGCLVDLLEEITVDGELRALLGVDPANVVRAQSVIAKAEGADQ